MHKYTAISKTEGTYELVHEETKEVLLLLRLRAEESSEERECLRTNIGERIEGERLEDLQNGEEILLQPILEVPHEKVRAGNIRMEKRLVAKVPG